jgi:hypothetical protein
MKALSFQFFQNIVSNPFLYRLFLLKNLPMAFWAGLRVKQLTTHEAVIGVKYRYLNKNPFRSIYFAVLSMAAELSTGILAFAHIADKRAKVSMLVVGLNAQFLKKATGFIHFKCTNGNDIAAAIQQTINTGEGVSIICRSVGVNEHDEIVAIFEFNWSFKIK